MKERKRLGRKKRRKGLSKKESLYGILLAIIIVSILFTYSSLRSPSNQTNKTFQLKAAIVDHGSIDPTAGYNQTFIQTATNTLKKAGYTVDYYPGEEVTIEFYRNLPTHRYGLVILRVHAAGDGWLFTSEPYSNSKYVYEQLTDRIGPVAYSLEEAKRGIGYFGVGPLFVKSSMNGRFENTAIIMMGCDGLTYTNMAEAFIEKGAKVYIGWNGSTSAPHIDQSTTQLLKHLITEKQTIKQAVTNTMKEVGPDPADGSILLYYPDTLVDNYVIPNSASNLILNDATISGYDSESSLRHVHCLRCGK